MNEPQTPEDGAAKHPVDQTLPPVKLIGAGLQHVAAMYAGVVAPPLVVGIGVGLSTADIAFLMSASLFAAGIATLLQTLGFWKVGSRLPFVNGVSFAGVAPMLAIAKTQSPEDALPVIYGAVIVAGVLGFLLAPWFCKLVRFFPPIVTGTVITLIGVSLLPVAFNWAQGGNHKADDYGSLTNIGLAAASLLITVVLRRVLRGFLKQLSILLGLLAGTLISLPLGAADFSGVTDADLIGLPTPFHFGAPQFSTAAVISICIVMLAIMTESTADVLALRRGSTEVSRRQGAPPAHPASSPVILVRYVSGSGRPNSVQSCATSWKSTSRGAYPVWHCSAHCGVSQRTTVPRICPTPPRSADVNRPPVNTLP